MVAKRVAGVAGAAAGGAAGGFFNNPGAIALAGIAITIVTSLLIFRKDISNFFGNLSLPQLPEIALPSFPDINIDFPTFEFPEFPDITFPDINIDFPDFDFGNIFSPQVDEERMDVPFGEGGQEIDIVPDVTGGRADRLAGVIDQETPDVVVTETPTDTGTLFEVSIGGNEPEGVVSGDPDVSGFDFTPLTTLSDIINEFGVSASQAADILGQGLQNFGDFIFGTNTGSGFAGEGA